MSSEQDVCVMELPAKRTHIIKLPKEDGGDMITMKAFLSLVGGRVVNWDFLRVGSECFTEFSEATRSVHFYLLDNCPWCVYTKQPIERLTETGPNRVFLQGDRGRYTFDTSACKSILDLTVLIENRVGLSPSKINQYRYIYDGRDLQLESNISILHSKSIVFMVNRLRGGGGTSGMPFVDVTSDMGPVKLKWSADAPDWRRTWEGLSLEGICTNRSCRAHDQMVIMYKGHVDFDLINEAHECRCPICKETVVPVTCAFNNCRWKFIGRKIEKLGQPPRMFKTEWKSAGGDYYERFSPDESGTAHFLDLKILCTTDDKRNRTAVCVACGMHIFVTKTLKCGHVVHEECSDLASGCIECEARGSMTCYQHLFG